MKSYACDGKSAMNNEERRSLGIISLAWLSLSTFYAWWYQNTERLSDVQLKDYLSRTDLSGESGCVFVLRTMEEVR